MFTFVQVSCRCLLSSLSYEMSEENAHIQNFCSEVLVVFIFVQYRLLEEHDIDFAREVLKIR